VTLLVDAVGWAAAGCLLVGYALLSSGRLGPGPRYHLLNLAGAVGLAANGAYHRAWPSTAVNVVWLGIGLTALTGYIGRRSVERMTSPLQEPTFLILTALAGAPLHGYGVIQEVSRLSGGRVVLRPGTLYGALDRLSDQGLVEADREEVVDGRLRRYYRLTEEGAGLLRAEAQRLADNAAQARRRLGRRAVSPAHGTGS
jgi:DNA-binding PadR family transcriptional regulator